MTKQTNSQGRSDKITGPRVAFQLPSHTEKASWKHRVLDYRFFFSFFENFIHDYSRYVLHYFLNFIFSREGMQFASTITLEGLFFLPRRLEVQLGLGSKHLNLLNYFARPELIFF